MEGPESITTSVPTEEDKTAVVQRLGVSETTLGENYLNSTNGAHAISQVDKAAALAQALQKSVDINTGQQISLTDQASN